MMLWWFVLCLSWVPSRWPGVSCCGHWVKLRTWGKKKSCSVVFLPEFSRMSLENPFYEFESSQGVWSGHTGSNCSSYAAHNLQFTMNFHYLGIKDVKWLLCDGWLDFSIFLSKLTLVCWSFNSLFPFSGGFDLCKRGKQNWKFQYLVSVVIPGCLIPQELIQCDGISAHTCDSSPLNAV